MLSEAAETKMLPLFGHSRMCWPDPMFNKIALFGVGLIGGSFALALKKAGKVETGGWVLSAVRWRWRARWNLVLSIKR